MQAGACLSMKDINGKTPYDLAVDRQRDYLHDISVCLDATTTMSI